MSGFIFPLQQTLNVDLVMLRILKICDVIVIVHWTQVHLRPCQKIYDGAFFAKIIGGL